MYRRNQLIYRVFQIGTFGTEITTRPIIVNLPSGSSSINRPISLSPFSNRSCKPPNIESFSIAATNSGDISDRAGSFARIVVAGIISRRVF
jgi:hypothetical protein